jgi:hypothetical protein
MAPSLGSTLFWFIYFNYYYAFYAGSVILSAQIIYNLVIVLTDWFQFVSIISLRSDQQDAEEMLDDHEDRIDDQEEKLKEHDAFLEELRDRLRRRDALEGRPVLGR